MLKQNLGYFGKKLLFSSLAVLTIFLSCSEPNIECLENVFWLNTSKYRVRLRSGRYAVRRSENFSVNSSVNKNKQKPKRSCFKTTNY